MASTDNPELRELLEKIQGIIDRCDALDDLQLDSPPEWLPRESQERLREAVRQFTATMREILPADSRARQRLGDDDLN